MRVHSLLPLAASTLFASFAHAQYSVYATLSEHGFEFDNSNTFYESVGVTGGFTYNLLKEGRFYTAVDARGSVAPTRKSGVGGGSGSANFKVGFNPTKVPLRPYAELGLGFVHAHTAANPFESSSFTSPTLNLFLGLDIRLAGGFDLRLLETGGDVALNGSNHSVSLSTAGIGLVYHFPSKPI